MKSVKIKNKKNGFTLIEVLVYLGLFAILIGGVGISVWNLSESAGRNKTKAMIQVEGDFLIGKINWVLSGVKSVDSPAVGSTSDSLSVTKWNPAIGEIMVSLTTGDIVLARGTNSPRILNNTDVKVTDLSFTHQFLGGTNPESVKVSFKLTALTPNGMTITQEFTTTSYLRR